MDCSVRLARALLGLAVAAWAGQPQAPPPVITATTRLVQVSVIAKEQGGEPRRCPPHDVRNMASWTPQRRLPI